jgi:hypothetical protein
MIIILDTVHCLDFSQNIIFQKLDQWLELALSNRPGWTGTLPPYTCLQKHLVPKILCLKKLRMMENAQNTGQVYYDLPLSESF